MNIPSTSALLDREKLIRTIQDLCETVNNIADNAITKEDLGNNQVVVIAEQPIPETWPVDSMHTMQDLIEAINDDETAIPGRMYLSSVGLADLPYYDDNGTPERLIQAEMKIEIMAKELIPDGNEGSWKKVILFTVTSSLPPHHWEYTSVWGGTGEWIAFKIA